MRRFGTWIWMLGLVGCSTPADAPPTPRVTAAEPQATAAPEPSPEPAETDAVAAEGVADTEPAPEEVIDPDTPPVPPADYGMIKPPMPIPPEEELTVHGLVGYEVVAVYAKPDIKSTRLGYMRIGTRVKVTPKLEGTDCPKGFYGLPQGGFACASKGLVVDAKKAPFMLHAPPPPRHDEPLPYDYGYVRKWNSPMWWRIPNKDELAEADKQRAVREAERKALAEPPAPAAGGSSPDTKALPKPPDVKAEDPLANLPKPDGVDDKVANGPPPAPTPSPAPAAAEPAEEPPPPIKLPLNPATPWLERGFFLSVAQRMREEGRAWWRTARGGYVQAAHAYRYKPKDFEGIALTEEVTFPVGFVMATEAKLVRLEKDDKLKLVEKIERRTGLNLTEEVQVHGTTYMMTDDGTMVRKKDLRIPELQPVPKGIKPWERWVDVSLKQQMLVAYEGSRPVYVTLVSTGKKGPKDEPFDTPTGRWRIRSKHISTTMDGNTASDGNYSIQDVPWAMFFKDSYALHGAFWHRGFGYRRSHGCVNLGPSDARWLFNWTTPFLPEGWHGVHATPDSPGTTVVVRE